MDKRKLKETIFIGVVEDNQDPKRLGRVKVRVHSVYDTIQTSDLPFSRPWKDLDGNQFNVPEVGKIVSVVFDNGDVHNPEYIYAEHYNINLENKLKGLSDSDYTTFKGVMVDQSTQIYRSNSEGLKVDHEYTNINLDPYGNIQLNIRDDKSVITLGSKNADESIVLGDTFMTWFDSFVSNLMGSNGGPYLGNLGSPVLANPNFLKCLEQYQSMRDDFLSDHIKATQNGKIIAQKRPYINQSGDIVSTTDPNINNLSKMGSSPYSPNSNYQPFGEVDANPASAEKYDPSKITNGESPTPFTGTATTLQINTITSTINDTLSRGQGHGQCARYTYNHAYNYVNILRNKTPNMGPVLSAGGNAKDSGYHDSLMKLGWSKSYSATINKNQIIKELSKDYEVGDIVVYAGLDGSNQSYSRYGHTQIFTAGFPPICTKHKWATDNATNYNTTFVYKSKPCDSWFFAVFKAPKS